MKDYEPKNWYWNVAGDLTRAFSSALGTYVPADDATLTAWLADGTLPTQIDTEANLGDVLAPYLIRPVHAGVLVGYQESQANGLVIQVNFKVLFNILKRISVLEGKPLTAAQARAYVKGLL